MAWLNNTESAEPALMPLDPVGGPNCTTTGAISLLSTAMFAASESVAPGTPSALTDIRAEAPLAGMIHGVCAWPFASVTFSRRVAVLPGKAPLAALVRSNRTTTPACAWPLASVSRTSTGSGSCAPGAAVWLAPETSVMREASERL
jgi:hypothetical protein